jgi:hypothetical protein
MPLFTDLDTLKIYLEIDPDNTEEDAKLTFINTCAANLIEEYLGRQNSGIFYNHHVDFYNGTGTQKLVLRSRPVYTVPTIQVWIDEGGLWGQAPNSFDNNPQPNQLVFGTDFALWVDQDDGSSRRAILIRNNDYWPRPVVRTVGLLSSYLGTGYGTIKVDYYAGWTPDQLPASFQMGVTQLISTMRNLFPLGEPLSSESYEERAISYLKQHKAALTGFMKQTLFNFRNWHF